MTNNTNLYLLFQEAMANSQGTDFLRVPGGPTLRYGEVVGKLRRELNARVGAVEADVLLSNVSGEEALLESLGPVVGLARVARGALSREAYLEQWGHRGPLEAEVSAPRPGEDPAWLDRQLASYHRQAVDVEGLRQQCQV